MSGLQLPPGAISDQQPVQPTQGSTMPNPPMKYAAIYTDEAVAAGKVPPPPRPPADLYYMFGAPLNMADQIIQPLESQGIRRLYPTANVDHKRELKKLNFSIVMNFLDLLDILIRSPASKVREEKIEDIHLLFIHMHHLINEYRPHQARETLRCLLDKQRRERRDLVDKMDRILDSVVDLLHKSAAEVQSDSGGGNADAAIVAVKKELAELSTALAAAPPEDGRSLRNAAVDSHDSILCSSIDSS